MPSTIQVPLINVTISDDLLAEINVATEVRPNGGININITRRQPNNYAIAPPVASSTSTPSNGTVVVRRRNNSEPDLAAWAAAFAARYRRAPRGNTTPDFGILLSLGDGIADGNVTPVNNSGVFRMIDEVAQSYTPGPSSERVERVDSDEEDELYAPPGEPSLEQRDSAPVSLVPTTPPLVFVTPVWGRPVVSLSTTPLVSPIPVSSLPIGLLSTTPLSDPLVGFCSTTPTSDPPVGLLSTTPPVPSTTPLSEPPTSFQSTTPTSDPPVGLLSTTPELDPFIGFRSTTPTSEPPAYLLSTTPPLPSTTPVSDASVDLRSTTPTSDPPIFPQSTTPQSEPSTSLLSTTPLMSPPAAHLSLYELETNELETIEARPWMSALIPILRVRRAQRFRRVRRL